MRNAHERERTYMRTCRTLIEHTTCVHVVHGIADACRAVWVRPCPEVRLSPLVGVPGAGEAPVLWRHRVIDYRYISTW